MAVPPLLQMITPLPPARSGIAQYSRDLLHVAAEPWRIAVTVEPDSTPPTMRGLFAWRATFGAQYDASLPTIFQLGNSGHHRQAFELALRDAGVLVLHDVVVHQGRLGELLRRRGGARYRRLLLERYGADGAASAEAVLRGRGPDDLSAWPLCEDYVEHARVTLTHSEYARRRVLERVPGADVRVAPMGVPLPADMPRGAARRALGVPADAFVIASVTHVNPFKRLPIVLRALRRIVRDMPEAVLLVAGSVAPGLDLAGEVAYCGLQEHVRLLGYVSDDLARLVAAAADVCVNLRYPSAGETSASLLRLLGAGRPVIVTDAAEQAEYPDEVVLKLAPDRYEVEVLAELLRDLRRQPELAHARGAAARSFVETDHSMGAMLRVYRAALHDAYGLELPNLDNATLREPPPNISRLAPPQPHASALDAALGRRIAGLGIERDDAALARLAGAMLDLGLTGGSTRREDTDMNEAAAIRPELLEILACPVCKTRVRLVGDELLCDSCGRHYRIEEGIPIMLVEDEE